MKKTLWIIFFALFVIANCHAQDKTDEIKELLKLMDSETMINNVLDNMVSVVRKQAKSQLEDNQKFEQFMSFVRDEERELAKNLEDDELTQIISDNFTRDEISELIKFCNTSAGQKLIKLMPDIQKDLVNKAMSKYGPDLQKKLQDKLDELKYR
jgi:hypothetical protein